MAPPTTVRSYPSLYGESPPKPLAKLLTPPGPTPELSTEALTTWSPASSPGDSQTTWSPSSSPPTSSPGDSQTTWSPTSSPGDSQPPPSEPSPAPSPVPPPSPLTEPSPVPAPPPPQVGLIVGTVIGGLILLVAVGIFVIWYRRRNRRKPDEGPTTSDPNPTPPAGYPIGLSQSIFSYEELALATNGFSEYNFIGQGGFGHVHKGVLPNEKVVAVKQLKLDSKQGECEFRAEIEVISRVHHKHLVSLVGYCISGEQRLLVYDFVPNGNLEYHLHELKRPTMNWPTRLKIAMGSAKGLAYLHEDCQPKIIHRDIKSANILLDYNFDAKVSDFGLAKFSLDSVTHISTRVMGTFGYLAPEYASSGKLTDKSDVFSFGVVLLELITGLQPFDKTQSFPNDSMVEWVCVPFQSSSP